MDWATIISIAGIVGTWITIVLVYFTLREMRSQRIASQKPDLIIPETTIFGYSENLLGLGLFKSSLPIPRDWSRSEKYDRDTWKESERRVITLYNVGFGVAKNIELKWTIGYDKTIQQMKDYFYQNSGVSSPLCKRKII